MAAKSTRLFEVEHSWAVDNHPSTCETYIHNIRGASDDSVFCEDIKRFNFKNLENLEKDIDGFAGSVELQEGHQVVIGEMPPGTVVEVATWQGTGRPDESASQRRRVPRRSGHSATSTARACARCTISATSRARSSPFPAGNRARSALPTTATCCSPGATASTSPNRRRARWWTGFAWSPDRAPQRNN